jgi:hypothetical protein
LFLFVITAVAMFVPGILQPFVRGGQDDVVTANRVGDSLSKGLLSEPGSPYLLDSECTVAFFEGDSPAECRYAGSTIRERLGLSDTQFVNVTVRGNVSQSGPDGVDELLCWDTSTASLSEQRDVDCSGADFVPLSAGGDPPANAESSVTARRIVSLEDTDVHLVVKLW